MAFKKIEDEKSGLVFYVHESNMKLIDNARVPSMQMTRMASAVIDTKRQLVVKCRDSIEVVMDKFFLG